MRKDTKLFHENIGEDRPEHAMRQNHNLGRNIGACDVCFPPESAFPSNDSCHHDIAESQCPMIAPAALMI